MPREDDFILLEDLMIALAQFRKCPIVAGCFVSALL